MGKLAIVKEWIVNGLITRVTANPGANMNLTPRHFSAPGDDAQALAGDAAHLAKTGRTGSYSILGYADAKNAPRANAGEKIIYARDEATGAIVVEIWLKNDGTALMKNANAEIELSPTGEIKGENSNGVFQLDSSGNFNVNGVTIDSSGNITSPGTVDAQTVEAATSLKVATKEVNGHTHAGVTSGPSSTDPF